MQSTVGEGKEAEVEKKMISRLRPLSRGRALPLLCWPSFRVRLDSYVGMTRGISYYTRQCNEYIETARHVIVRWAGC
jgi:hypothetical protein